MASAKHDGDVCSIMESSLWFSFCWSSPILTAWWLQCETQNVKLRTVLTSPILFAFGDWVRHQSFFCCYIFSFQVHLSIAYLTPCNYLCLLTPCNGLSNLCVFFRSFCILGWDWRTAGNSLRNQILSIEACSRCRIPCIPATRFLSDKDLPSKCRHVNGCYLCEYIEEGLEPRNNICACLERDPMSPYRSVSWEQFEWRGWKAFHGKLWRVFEKSAPHGWCSWPPLF